MRCPIHTIHRIIATLTLIAVMGLSYWAATLVAADTLPTTTGALIVTTSPTSGSDAELIDALSQAADARGGTLATLTDGTPRLAHVADAGRGATWLREGLSLLPGAPPTTIARLSELEDARQFYVFSGGQDAAAAYAAIAHAHGSATIVPTNVESSFLLEDTALGALVVLILFTLCALSFLTVLMSAHTVGVVRLAGYTQPEQAWWLLRFVHGRWAWVYAVVPLAALGASGALWGWDAVRSWGKYATIGGGVAAAGYVVSVAAGVAVLNRASLRDALKRKLPQRAVVVAIALSQLAVSWPLLEQVRDATNAAAEYQAQNAEADLWAGREQPVVATLTGSRSYDELSPTQQDLAGMLSELARRDELLLVESHSGRDSDIMIVNEAARRMAAPQLPAVTTPTLFLRGTNEPVTQPTECGDSCPVIPTTDTTIFTFATGFGGVANRLTTTPDAVVVLPPGWDGYPPRTMVAALASGRALFPTDAIAQQARDALQDPQAVASLTPAATQWHRTHAHAHTQLRVTTGTATVGILLLIVQAALAGALYRLAFRQSLRVHALLGIRPRALIATITATHAALAALIIFRAHQRAAHVTAAISSGAWRGEDALITSMQILPSAVIITTAAVVTSAAITIITTSIPVKEYRP